MNDQKFHIGEHVLVRDLEFETGLTGHMRAPAYCRGKIGIIERCCGKFGNPEDLAYGGSGEPAQPLYRVRFSQKSIWQNYTGPSTDTIEIEIYQHWLKPYAA
ncbi:MAG: SH3-like domain-containing protein [Alphaproteobacteria bacterium]